MYLQYYSKAKREYYMYFMYVLIFTIFFLRIACFFKKKLCIFITYSLALQFTKNLLIVWWIECEICSMYVQLAWWYRYYVLFAFMGVHCSIDMAIWAVKFSREYTKLIDLWPKINIIHGNFMSKIRHQFRKKSVLKIKIVEMPTIHT